MVYYGNSTYYNSDFSHFGIKGMKWGVRRYQNEDGSYTSAGKKRYSGETEKAYQKYKKSKKAYKDAVQEYNRKTLNGMIYNKDATTNLQKAAYSKKYAKEDFSDSKLEQKLSKHTQSAREIKLMEKYKEQGMPEKDAKIAAYKRARTEKIMAIAGATALAAAASYAAYRHYDNITDRVIKSGTTLQNISTNANKSNDHDFYSSRGVLDGMKYQGMYGDQLRKPKNIFGMPTGERRDVYRTRFNVDKDIKIASQKSAVETLNELANKDADFKSKLLQSLQSASGRQPSPKQNMVIARGLTSLRNGKIDSNVYDAMNLDLVAHDPKHQEISDKFFNALRSKGYGAVKDSNDTKFSGYNARTAAIIFGKGDNMHVTDSHKLSDSEINKPLGLVTGGMLAKQAAKEAGIGLGAYGTAKAISNASANKRVSKYRKEHPNSKLSNREIERLLDQKGLNR